MNNCQNYIIGATGYIGHYLYENSLKRNHRTFGTRYHNQGDEYVKFDLKNDTLKNKFGDKIEGANLLLCAANASIDSCKKNVIDSNSLNVDATKKIILEAMNFHMKVIFLSSEAVFDGKKGLYSENDKASPVTVYGEQKVKIENFLLDQCPNSLIFRISRATDICLDRKDILNEMYRKLQHNEEICCIRNQRFSLTYVKDIADAIIKATENDMVGLYNLSNGESISRYELALRIAEGIGANTGLVSEKDVEEFNFLDKRHLNGGLDGTKISRELGMKFKKINWIIEEFLKNAKK